MVVGVLAREQQPVTGEVEVTAAAVGKGLFRLTVLVRNLAPLEAPAGRDDALLRTLVSAHVLLGWDTGCERWTTSDRARPQATKSWPPPAPPSAGFSAHGEHSVPTRSA